MAISQRMDLRQSQSLVMTPQLQQAIKLLELSNLELDAYVEEQLESNPLLERESEATGESEATAEPSAPMAAYASPARPAPRRTPSTPPTPTCTA